MIGGETPVQEENTDSVEKTPSEKYVEKLESVSETKSIDETVTVGPVVHKEFSTLFELQLEDVRKALERKEERKELLLNKNIPKERVNVLKGKFTQLPPIPTGQVRLYLSGSVTGKFLYM